MLVQVIKHIPETGSTNRDLAEHIANARSQGGVLPEFYTLCASYQTGGRGQGNNHWFSDAGQNLLASIYFRPKVAASRQFLFNQYFSLTVRKFLLEYLPEVEIKWPNDIYVHGKKIAGILIEHTVSGDTLSHTIAGIGLNINQETFPDTLPNPTSIYLETGKKQDVNELAGRLVTQLRMDYGRLENEKIAVETFPETSLPQEYLSCLYRRGKMRPYAIGGDQIMARIDSVDQYGRLLLSDDDGHHWCCGMKEIKFL